MITTEYRDARFETLDALIARGWGDVPFREIERLLKAHGGTLPDPPESSGADPEFTAWARAELAHRAHGKRTAVVLAAIEAGYQRSADIADVSGLPSGTVTSCLQRLRESGKLAADTIRGPQGQKIYVYRRAA